MTLRLAERMAVLGTESAFDVLVRARALEAQGREVVHLEIGEPDFDTPAHIVEAGVQALRDGQTHYTPAAGLPQLRDGHRRVHRAARAASSVGAGAASSSRRAAKPIMFFAILALAEPGDEVIYPDPGFPIYESIINFAGGDAGAAAAARGARLQLRPRRAARAGERQDAAGHHQLAAQPDRRRHRRRRAGASWRGWRVERDFMVLSDEIYTRMRLRGRERADSIVARPGMAERTIILDGFSKTYAMTGWRLGYGVMPRALARANDAAGDQQSARAPPRFTQLAGRRGADRPAGAGRRDGGRVPPPARRHRRGPERDPGHLAA